MMELGRSIGHEAAHQLVRQASRRASAEGTALREALLATPGVSEQLDDAALDRLLDPAAYLGLAPASARAAARRILG